MTQSALGDGCDICNTSEAISRMESPEEVAGELRGNGFFTDDQATYIASEVYQPMMYMIEVLSNKIDQLSKRVN